MEEVLPGMLFRAFKRTWCSFGTLYISGPAIILQNK